MIDIRAALPHEYAEAGRITHDAYLLDGFLTRADGTHNGDYGASLSDAASRARGGELLVALEGERVVGTVTWCPVGSAYRELATRPDQGEFRMLAVGPQARGHGVGRRLVQRCLERAREASMTEVVLCSMPGMTAAHALYRCLGFERAPDLDWAPEVDVPLWGFRRSL